MKMRFLRDLPAIGAALLSLAACAGDGPRGPAAAVGTEVRLIDERELVVIYELDVAAEPLKAAVAARGYAVLDETALPALSLQMLTLEIPVGRTGPEAIREVEALEPRTIAGVNHAFETPPAELSADPLRYADRLLDWPAMGCVAGAPIGMIDTMVDAADPALSGTRVVTKVFDGADRTNTRHGTDVAAILAEPNRLRSVEIRAAAVVGGDDPAGPAAGVDEIVKALDWLAADGVRVVNVSLAGPYNKILDRGVRAAAERGLILVAAVGNDGAEAPPLYPAAFDGVLAVTAVDVEADVYRNANRGGHIDVAAPGVDVFVDTDERGRFATGTSIAAPFVTARIAADPTLASLRGVEEVRARLRRGATDLGPPGFDEVFGAGLVDGPAGCRTDLDAPLSSKAAGAPPS
ncbi:MAG: S8 family serine peptidase [Pseudomonadota bacterium]